MQAHAYLSLFLKWSPQSILCFSASTYKVEHIYFIMGNVTTRDLKEDHIPWKDILPQTFVGAIFLKKYWKQKYIKTLSDLKQRWICKITEGKLLHRTICLQPC